jgi:hypothetical protein
MSRAEDLKTLAETLLQTIRQLRDNPPDTMGALVTRCASVVDFGDTMLRLIEAKETVR